MDFCVCPTESTFAKSNDLFWSMNLETFTYFNELFDELMRILVKGRRSSYREGLPVLEKVLIYIGVPDRRGIVKWQCGPAPRENRIFKEIRPPEGIY